MKYKNALIITFTGITLFCVGYWMGVYHPLTLCALWENQDHIWYAFSAFGALGTLVVASYALNTWRKEKEYDLTIQNLALCNVAVQFIQFIRSPFRWPNELSKEYQDELLKHDSADKRTKMAMEDALVYQARKDKQQDVYEQILKMREQNWAVYGPKHNFFLFFDYIISIDKAIMNAYTNSYYLASEDLDRGDEGLKASLKENRKVMYAIANDDSISDELNTWIEKLQAYRKRQ